jgi:hypothetical protein
MVTIQTFPERSSTGGNGWSPIGAATRGCLIRILGSKTHGVHLQKL